MVLLKISVIIGLLRVKRNEKIYTATESIFLASSVFPNNEQHIDVFLEPCQTYKLGVFNKKVNSF